MARFSAELRDEGYSLLRAPAALALDPWLAELLERVGTEWLEVPDDFVPATLAALDLRARSGASILAVDRGGITTPNPPPDQEIHGGDRLLAFASTEGVVRLRELLGAEPSPH